MVSTHKNLSALDEEILEQIANDFQPRLLMFCLRHYRDFRPLRMELSPLSPRMQDLLGALLLPLQGVKRVLTLLEGSLEQQILRAEVERTNEPEALVIIALFNYCHDQQCSTVLVGQIASIVNVHRRRVGEEADLKARGVGSILKSLGFVTDKIQSFGRGLLLTAPVKRRIHELLESYSLVATDAARVAGC